MVPGVTVVAVSTYRSGISNTSINLDLEYINKFALTVVNGGIAVVDWLLENAHQILALTEGFSLSRGGNCIETLDTIQCSTALNSR